MTKEQLAKYYLDFNEVNKLESADERDMIHGYYRDMVSMAEEGRDSTATSFFNTLEKGGFIKNREIEDRQEKLGDLIND
jgi:hypothetical protein